jgi:hypothetical protein
MRTTRRIWVPEYVGKTASGIFADALEHDPTARFTQVLYRRMVEESGVGEHGAHEAFIGCDRMLPMVAGRGVLLTHRREDAADTVMAEHTDRKWRCRKLRSFPRVTDRCPDLDRPWKDQGNGRVALAHIRDHEPASQDRCIVDLGMNLNPDRSLSMPQHNNRLATTGPCRFFFMRVDPFPTVRE